MNKITDNYTLVYLIGVLATFPSMLPTALSIIKNPTLEVYKKAALEKKFYLMAFFYGFLNMLVFFLINRYIPDKYNTYFVAGIIMGLIYPTLGTIDDYAKKMYGITNYWNLYIGAQIMYFIFYGLIINGLVDKL